ncbi:hypothetical protein N824_27330 [Pedobacter sp. V48]|nr:hypothetical protein N824_27330 [Pedobacter sp. V48]
MVRVNEIIISSLSSKINAKTVTFQEQSLIWFVKLVTLIQNIMEQFRIEVADNKAFGRFLNIKAIKNEQYQIYNDQQERIGTIEIDNEDRQHYRQSLDCKVDLPLLNSIRDSILLHEEQELAIK